MFAACSSLPLFALKTPPPPSSSISFLNNKPTFSSPHSTRFDRPRLVAASHTNISPELEQSINNQTKISTKLATHLFTKKFPNTNVMFCPISVHVILSLIAAEAKDKTLKQILGFLKINNKDDFDSLYAPFSKSLSPSHGLGFALWFYKNRLMTSCNEEDVNKVTKAGLMHDYRTKGVWYEQFECSEVKESEFYLLDGNIVKVPFMGSKEKQYVCEYDGFKVLRFPHFIGQERCKYSMYLYLPDAKDGLGSLIEKMCSKPDFVDTHVPDQKVEVGEVYIPGFEIFSKFDVSDVLKELGLVLPFSAEEGMIDMVEESGNQNFFVSGFHHKFAMLMLRKNDNKGEVSSDAPVEEGCSLETQGKVDFIADHPFVFLVRDDVTKVVFFMGQVIDPSVGIDDMLSDSVLYLGENRDW